ncbi:MAG: type II secretion system protein GspL [Limnohabitans sp.]
MHTLLLHLPATPPSAAAMYGVSETDLAMANARMQPNHAPLALLPRPARQTEIVALVPATALSWHRVNLPAGLGRSSARLQAALQGLLEDQLLQDFQQVHLALPPQWKSGEPVWVAACDKAWLKAHLQVLADAGLTVQRIVPEFAPPDSGQQCHALGDETDGWLWCCDAAHGVTGWPVAAAAHMPPDWLADASLQAEPALAGWAQTRTATTVQLVDGASHWLLAARGDWNLAQFELQSDAHSRRLQNLRRRVSTLTRSPQWRPARWGLAALLLSQLAGLQAWTWMTRLQWQAEQERWTQILQNTFPHVTVVVDAPLQMAREVARLRQRSGQLTPQDFESQLQALGHALPPGTAGPAKLGFQDGQLQWPELPLDPAQQAGLEQALQRQGYRLLVQNGTSRLQAPEAQP